MKHNTRHCNETPTGYLKRLIKDSGMTQAQFAKAVGASECTISHACNGLISAPLACKLSAHFQVTADNFLPRTDKE